MTYPTAILTYSVPVGGAPPASLQAAVASVPVNTDILGELGASVTSDATAVVGPNVVRTIDILLIPGTPNAAATAAIDPEMDGIASIAVTTPGIGYSVSPVILITDPATETIPAFYSGPPAGGTRAHAQAYLKLQNGGGGPVIVNNGTDYSNGTTVAFVGGFPMGSGRQLVPVVGPGTLVPPPQGSQLPPGLFGGTSGWSTRVSDPPASGALNIEANVAFVTIVKKGRLYSSSTVVQFLGPVDVANGGIQATGVPVIVGGKVTGVLITNPGAGYIVAPEILIIDPTGAGTGVEASVSMARGLPATASLSIAAGFIVGVTVTSPGDGYVRAPTAVIYDPAGTGSGGAITVGTCMGLSRIDVLAKGSGYRDPLVNIVPLLGAAFLPALEAANTQYLLDVFSNFMTAAISRFVAAPVFASVPA